MNNKTICYLRTNNYSFTLIEILVVATIISLLAAGGLASYSTITKNSLDTRRKADIEQIRAALEMYRSNVGSYPNSSPLSSPLQDEDNNIYLLNVPKDPKTKSSYLYNPSGICDSGEIDPCCDGTAGNSCTTYTLSATLENGNSYVATPYGTEITTPIPTPTQ